MQSKGGEMMSKKGFTLIEVVVVVAIIALLAGILTPLIFKYIDEANETRALGDCRNISTALLLFHKDTGTWPYCNETRRAYFDYIYGNMGDLPAFGSEASSCWGSKASDMYFHLVTNGEDANPTYYRTPRMRAGTGTDRVMMGILAHGWKGPYLPYVTDDPWAYKYVVSVGCFDYGVNQGPNYHVWCLSAGPGFDLDTPVWATEPHFDDIGYRTK
jgi:general secretion pathway protein G